MYSSRLTSTDPLSRATSELGILEYSPVKNIVKLISCQETTRESNKAIYIPPAFKEIFANDVFS